MLCYSVIERYGDTKMKQFIINHSLQLVTDIYPDYDSSKLDEIRYGLEAIYLSLTKVVAILLVSLLLGLFKEAVILLFFFNGLRSFAFGIHATKSWMCWIASSLLFIGLPYVCLHLNMPLVIQYFILAVTFICFLLYAPADTKKRPLVRKNRRIKFKLLTITVAVIVVTGVLGNMAGTLVCKIFRITEPISKGLAFGSASPAIGTAKAIEIGEVEGAMSSLAIAVSGILTVVLASVFAYFI